MNKFEQSIFQLAKKYGDHEEFMNNLNQLLDQKPQNKKGNNFLYCGNILYKFSFFDLALNSYNHALRYFLEKDDRAGESKCYTGMGIVYRNLSDYRKAIKYHQKSLKIAQADNDRTIESNCYTNLGTSYFSLGEYPKAIEYHEKSLEIDKEIKNRSGESSCYINLGNAYNMLGEYPKAIEYYQKSLEITRTLNNMTGEESICYRNLGVIYSHLGEPRKAIDYYKRSLEIAYDLEDSTGQSSCYTNIGAVYLRLGEYDKAIEFFEMSLEIKKVIEDRSGESRCYNALGEAYEQLGEFRKAIEYHEKALEITKVIEDRSGESTCYTCLGGAYESLGEYRNAIEYYKKSLKINKAIEDTVSEANCYMGIATVYNYLEDYHKAIEYYEKALGFMEVIKGRVGESGCYLGLGNSYNRLGEYHKAINYLEKSLAIMKTTEDRAGEASCYIGLGAANMRLGEYQKALAYHEKSRVIAEGIGNIDLERIVNQNLGAVYYEQNFERAFNCLKRAIELSEVIGKGLVEEEYKIHFYGKANQSYEYMIPLCMRLNREEEAFLFTERSKSKTFLDMIAATNVKPPDKLTEQKTLLEDEASSLTRLREVQIRHLAKTTVTTEPGEVDRILKELNRIYDKMEEIDPEYVFMRQARPLPLDKIKEMLTSEKRNAVVVEYFITKDKTFIFVVTKDGLHVEPVSLSEEKLLKYVKLYEREVVNCTQYGAIGDTWLELSSFLIEPVSDYLIKNDLIYFIPFGTLHYIPLHALELNGEPLIKSHPVCYSPAASIIRFCKDKGSDKLDDCASFGIIFEDEAEQVAALFRSDPYIGEAANKDNVLECINRDIIHLSCHGRFDNFDPLSSGLLLHNEEILTAREIFNWRISSELVTLSACQTGLNETKPGDELIGLTRAFLYAGAPSVIVSLWSVFAPSTQELMLEFYKLLKNGKDKATALQEAQIAIMEKDEFAHPYFWAPFVLIGDWE